MNTEFFKHMFRIPHGWTNVLCHSSSPAVVGQKSAEWSDLQEEWAEKKAESHVTSQPRIRSKARRYLIRKVGNHRQLVLYVHHKWQTDTIYETNLLKAQDMCLKAYQTFSYAVVHFGDVRAECSARVVGHDQPFLHARPSEVGRTARTSDPSRCPCIG